MLGLRELAMVAAVVLVLYGRTGVIRGRRFQSIWPWIAPVRRKTGREDVGASPSPASAAPAPRRLRLDGNRLFWFLTIVAATAVASLIVTRSLIMHGAGPGPHP